MIWNTDTQEHLKGYGNGAGYPQAMMKLNGLRSLIDDFKIQDSDFVLSVDSDVIFTSPEVFKYVDASYGLIGVKHRPDYYTKFGSWSHMSGCLMFIRGDIAKKMCAMSEEELTFVQYQQFKPYNLTENEDVVLSYLATLCGANYFDLGTVAGLSSGDFENDIIQFTSQLVNPTHLRSFYHLNYCPTTFLGEPMNGAKWDIPKVLNQKGIKL